MLYRKFIILFCLFPYVLIAYSQESRPVFTKLSTLDGLSNNSVNCITQDSSGFIWIGTQDGLNRYDARQFKIYRNNPLSSNSLSNNYITSLAISANGMIWIGTDNGLCRLNPLTDSFTNYKNIPGKPGTLSQSSQPRPFIDSKDDLWVATAKGLNYYDPATNSFIQYNIATPEEIKKDASVNTIIKIIEDKQHRLWCLGIYKLLQFDKATRKFVASYDINLGANKEIVQKDETHFYLGQWEYGLVELDVKTKRVSRIPIKDPHNSSIVLLYDTLGEDDPSLFIGTTNSGIIKYYIRSKNEINFQPDIYEKHSVTGEFVGAIFRDQQQSIWFGTNKGIGILNPQIQLFDNKIPGQSFFPGQFEKFGEISAYYEKEDIRYLGVWAFGGLYKYTKDGTLLPSTGIISRDSKNHLSKNIFYFYPENDDLWICTDSGLVKLNETTGRTMVFIPFPADTSIHREHLRMRKVLPLGPDKFLVRTWNWGLLVFDKKRSQFTQHYLHSNNDTTSLPSDNIFDIIALSNGDIYVSTRNGLCRYLPDQNKFITYKPLAGRNDIIPLKKMDVDENNNLWIASNVGLFYFNTRTKMFTQYTTADGISMNICNRVCLDKKGKLWITTGVGISRFDPVSRRFLNFSVKDGLPVELYDGVLTRTADDKILAGFNGGYTLIDPEKFPFNEQVPPVRIAEIKVSDSLHAFALNRKGQKNLNLKYSQNFLQVSFAVLNFTNPEQNQFFYKLEGFDKDWHISDNGNIIYTNLPPGKYQLKVKGSNNSGIVNEAGDSLFITISPAFWQTWWFIFSVITLATAFIYLFIRKRINYIRKEAGLKHKIAETEMMALRAQMNPHFIFNCLSAIDNLVQTEQPDKATTYLARFAKLLRSVLDSSKNPVVSFDKDFETLELFLEMEQFRSDDKFTYHIDVDHELMNGDYKVPSLAIQPFVENAIYHGLLNKLEGSRNLSVEATLEQGHIKYIITDNGVGRKCAKELNQINRPEHISYGIQMSMERIHLFNQNGKTNDVVITDLIEKNKPAGTRVVVNIKIHESD